MSKDTTGKNWFARHKILTGFGVLLILGVIVSAASGSDSSTPTASNSDDANTNTAQESAPETTPEPAKFDIEAVYAKLSTGMTKAQVEEATGKSSENCTESDMGQLGKSESCSYGNAFIDKGSILVIYSNDELSTKSKSTY